MIEHFKTCFVNYINYSYIFIHKINNNIKFRDNRILFLVIADLGIG